MMKLKKKLYTDNSNCNYWKFQLHWNKLEWVNPICKIKRRKIYSTSSKKFYINKYLRKARWVGHVILK